MISKKLKERMYLIKATPLPDRVKDSYSHRRGKSAVMMEEGEDLSEKYDTFFDYEDDLVNLKPSGEQYADMVSDDPYVILEERDDQVESSYSSADHIVMEAAEEAIDNNEIKTYKDVVGFEFIQCNFVKNDGNRCKRQAPKGKEICSVHRKYKEKNGQ